MLYIIAIELIKLFASPHRPKALYVSKATLYSPPGGMLTLEKKNTAGIAL